MKVLMTADTVGGVWTYAVELIRALSPHGVEFALATMGARLSDAQRKQIAELPNVILHESEYKLEWMENPWADVDASGQWLLEIESRFAPDLVHLNGYSHAALPWAAPKLIVCHSCVLSWWLAVHGEPAPVEQWRRYRDRVTLGLRAADYIVAPSNAMLHSIETLYGFLAKSTAIIPNARNSSLFRPRSKAKFTFTAGRIWDQAKNIAALERVSEELEWPVVVAGEDAQREHSGDGANRSARVRFLGGLQNTDIARWMSRAPIYCMPARYEPFGLSILEAALSGCALALGDIPSLRENWDGAAVFVDPSDDKSLAVALKWLIDNPVFRERCAYWARLRALAFKPERMAASYLSVYRELLTQNLLKSARPMEVSACAS